MWRDHVLCPVHYPVRGECSEDCMAQRMEYPRAASVEKLEQRIRDAERAAQAVQLAL